MNKLREEIIENLLKALEDGDIPWRRGWSSAGRRPYNITTEKGYRGVNAFWLQWIQAEKRYTDPRWCTFKQAKDNGWMIKKGEKGTKVEFWSLYDTKEKVKLTLKESEELKRKLSGEEYRQRIKPMSSVYTVFNAEQITGVPELEIETYEWSPERIIDMRDVLLKNMNIRLEEGGDEASYHVNGDYIQMPYMERFESEYSYASTLLHEASHATGHESRLNRPLNNSFGSDEYAKEELRAEISAAFLAQELSLDNNKGEHLMNHTAYIQSWIGVLKKNPEELFAAIKDADKIIDYLKEKGLMEIQEEKEELLKPIEYGLVGNVALMEEKLNIPEDTRMTKWDNDLDLYQPKMNVSMEELQSRYEELQQTQPHETSSWYEKIENLAKIENELQIPQEKRLTQWFGDMLSYETKLGVSREQVEERLQEIEESYVCNYTFSYYDATRDLWKSTVVEADSPEHAESLFLDIRNNSDYYKGLELVNFKREKDRFISYDAEGQEVSRYENIELKSFMPLKDRPQTLKPRESKERIMPRHVQ